MNTPPYSPMDAQDIRRAYLYFYATRGHAVIERAPLVLDGDPTTLFTGSGMQPVIPYLLGEPHEKGNRLVDSQTCLRAQDINDIGDNRHTTFFEMLGNWSLGDYYKRQQIEWMWEFLIEVVGLDPSKLYVTCFIGAPEYGIAKDTEAADIWQKLFDSHDLSSDQADIGSEEAGYARGMKDGERIFYYDGSKNWWSRNGAPESTPIGDPCGPDSEMFYDFGTEHDTSFGEYCHPNCDCGRFMEIGNNVFMGYRKVADGLFEPLEKPNIDHGSGLERIAAAKLNDPDVFKISLLWPIIEKLQALSGKTYESHTKSMRVIADHLRAATFLAVDGCVPSNKQQGYVMRRLIRRAMVKAFDLGVEQNFMEEIIPIIANLYHNDFPDIASKRYEIIAILAKEEKVFRQTLRNGLKEMQKMSNEKNTVYVHIGDTECVEGFYETTHAHDVIFNQPVKPWETRQIAVLTGNNIFMLYDTYGFPSEISVETATNEKINITEDWTKSFNRYMTEQRLRSRTATKGVFKGGLTGQSQAHRKLHTATHLMYQALRDVLGAHVIQRGSNITDERLRFDFSHPKKVTPEEIVQVETIVNDQMHRPLDVSWAEYPTRVAREELGALGQFGDRYGETVKVYTMIEKDAEKPFSFEICGGPHVENTKDLYPNGEIFKIVKEESSSAGVRRIKAVLTQRVN